MREALQIFLVKKGIIEIIEKGQQGYYIKQNTQKKCRGKNGTKQK